MNFWKRNLPIMLKLMGTQIIMSMLGKMLYLAVSEIEVLLIVGIACSIGVFYYMVYDLIWKAGCDEALRPNEERTNIGAFTGAVIGFGGSLPGFVLSLIPVIFPLTANASGNATGWNYIVYVITEFFFNGQYTGLIRLLFPVRIITEANTQISLENLAVYNAGMPFYLLTIIPVALIGLIAYHYGLKDRRIFASSKKSDQKPILK